jgi:hypothetical protein
MSDLALLTLVVVQTLTRDLRSRIDDQRGEGVISAAIAVLVMAFLGVAMYKAFQGMFQDTADKTTNQIDQIGG